MDWKYKHFRQERFFPPDVVMEAARSFMTESLGWRVTDLARPAPSDAPDGFTTEGYSFTHWAIASFQIESTPDGAKVVVELLVERAGWRGFMLFDVGGYYNIQIRKWLDGIQWSLHQELTGSHDESMNPLVLAQNKPTAYIFNVCLGFIVVTFGLYFLVTFISALVGLVTGNLFLPGRGSLTIHGIWARTLSLLILMFGVFLAWRIKRKA